MAQTWLSKWFRGGRTPSPTKTRGTRLNLECLEDRVTPVTSVTNLTGGATATAMVQSLLGTGVQASNIVYTGAPVASGTFSGGQGTIGFDQGVILTSGDALGVLGPNTTSSYTGSNGVPGDSQLDAIVAPNPTLDASVLEFDFIPDGALLNFKYVFGSEEYPEFVGSSFNDVFAFFLNGQNVALIPNTSTPVAINTVNNGDGFGTPPSNPQFFVDNYTSAQLQIQLDGLTTVLTVTATVNPGVLNHIKLAIADASDTALDSAVFIQSGSFSAPKEPVLTVFNPVRFLFKKKAKTYTGLYTLINTGTAAQTGTAYVIFTKLPKKAWLKNATGYTSAGKPYIAINTPVGINKAIKLLVQIKNPLKKPFNSFFITKGLVFSATQPV
ncbi:MAG: choice-of-anchor L domain-containing protein [Gemmataceae bacterium]|nr:choice-of-anchor L domain-containing protein [Gemmataceae bacterium]